MRLAPLALVLALVPGLALFTGCGEKTVSRTDTKAVRDLSGNWNATDSRVTAEALVDQALKLPWADNFQKKNNRLPVVKVGKIIVRVDEPINTTIFTNDLIRAIVNSGKAEAVASSAEATQAREERKEQDVNASEATRKESFQETGADYLIIGEINTQNDQEGGKMQKFYSTDVKLTDIKTQKLVGLFNHKIAKDIDRSNYK